MRAFIKKIGISCLLLGALGIFLFPKQVMLQCLSWKASSYCKNAFAAKLEVDELLWQEGKIIFKGGKLRREGELNITFEEATLVPFLSWKTRTFGGELQIDGLKIVHCKHAIRPIPVPPSPSFHLLKLKLDTTVKDGELLLYDYLAQHHFFQKVHFDLSHHVEGKETCGTISFECAPDTPPFIAHFHSAFEKKLALTFHLQHHSVPVLSHMVAYFFQGYVPAHALQWDVSQGLVDGDVQMILEEGIPLLIKGRIDVCGVHAENIPLKMQGEWEHLGCELDADFSDVTSINALFELDGGKLCLEPTDEFWRGMCNLENVHSRVCIKEGKVESSTLKGNLMGMEGEMVLDWQANDILMQIGFSGDSTDICSHLPEKMRAGFTDAFPNDFFHLDASLKRSGGGLELDGLLAMIDQKENVYKLSFGCLLGSGENNIEEVWNLPKQVESTFSQSMVSFLDRLKGQFYLSQKRFGWFQGEGFPLEKFLTPFLLRNVKMTASGQANFKGTFDDRYLVLFYEGEDFCLEAPNFQFCVDKVKEHLASEVSAVHYVDLQTWSHLGFLPVKGGKYWQKNHGFHLEEASALVQFENNAIHIQDIATYGEEIAFHGNVDVTIHSLDNVELIIDVGQIHGSVKNAQQFLAHFKSSFLWELPVDGTVSGIGQPLYFHYHFSPTATLVEGKVKGTVNGLQGPPFLGSGPLQASIDYDCLSQGFTCSLTDHDMAVLTVQGRTQQREQEKEFVIEGKGTQWFETVGLKILQQSDESQLSFNCGRWVGKGAIAIKDKEIVVNQMSCWDDQNRGVTLSGSYDKQGKCLKGNLDAFQWDLTSIFAKNRSPWKPKGLVKGSGHFSWDIGERACTVEGLEIVVPTEKGVETYPLGRCFYDIGMRKIRLDGFDFSLPHSKVAWVAQVATALFPGGIDPSLIDCVRDLKQGDESLEGHLSLEVYPDNVWIYLSLKDGKYFLSGKPLDLKNFCLSYDPSALNVKTQCLFRDQYYWLHFVTDSMTMSQGTLSLSSDQEMLKEKLTAHWQRKPGLGWCLSTVEGIFCGMAIALTEEAKDHFSEEIMLKGYVGFDPSEIAPLMPPQWKAKIKELSLSGGCNLEGEFKLNKRNLSLLAFKGIMAGSNCQIAGVEWSQFSSGLEYSLDKIKFSHCALKDQAGTLSVNELTLKQANSQWKIAIDRLALSDMRLARLKSPWTRWGPRDKPFFRSLLVRSFVLENCQGDLINLNSMSGEGKVEFTNIPKKSFLSNLLFIPSEITARIGLDLSALVPARGIIEYKIQDGKIHFNEFKEMYSDGKLSRFYLADGFPAYIDFQGNLNMKLKMKQYNLLMKLAEFLTITVKGTLLNPSYTFSNHTDVDD